MGLFAVPAHHMVVPMVNDDYTRAAMVHDQPRLLLARQDPVGGGA